MKDVTNVEELRAKLVAPAPREEEKNEDECGLSNNLQCQLTTHLSSQEETEEQGLDSRSPREDSAQTSKQVTKEQFSLHRAGSSKFGYRNDRGKRYHGV